MTQPRAQPASRIPLPAAAAIVVVLLLLVGWWGYLWFAPGGPQSAPRPLTADDRWIQQKAKETGGDINKLNPQDQQKLILLRGETAPSVLKRYAESK